MNTDRVNRTWSTSERRCFPTFAKIWSCEEHQAPLNSCLIQILFCIWFANPIKIHYDFIRFIQKNKKRKEKNTRQTSKNVALSHLDWFYFSICMSSLGLNLIHSSLLSNRPKYTPCFPPALCIMGQCHDNQSNNSKMTCWWTRCRAEVLKKQKKQKTWFTWRELTVCISCLLFVPVAELCVVFSLFANHAKDGMETNQIPLWRRSRFGGFVLPSGRGCNIFLENQRKEAAAPFKSIRVVKAPWENSKATGSQRRERKQSLPSCK